MKDQLIYEKLKDCKSQEIHKDHDSTTHLEVGEHEFQVVRERKGRKKVLEKGPVQKMNFTFKKLLELEARIEALELKKKAKEE